MTAATIHGALAEVATRGPDDTAVVLDGEHWSFATLQRRVEAAAAVVAARTAPGDRVAVVAWNGPWWLEAAFGAPAAGRLLAMISPRLTMAEIEQQLDQVGARLVVVDTSVADPAALRRPGREVMTVQDWSSAVAGATGTATATTDRPVDDRAWLVFTSGTTSRPKAAVLTHRGLLAAIDATAAARPADPDDVYLYVFPMWHVALYNVLCRLLAGRPVVLQARFDARGVIDAVGAHGVTSISLAATMLDAVLDALAADPSASASLATLRDITYGAAPMPSTVLRRAAAALDVSFWQGYGMTELSGNAVFLSADDHRRGLAGEAALLRAAGRPAPGVEARIAGDGEIEVRAAQVMAGYWDDPDATAAAFTSDGWLRTGDVGALDESGLLSVLDRKKDVIITGGENVSAREVEEVLLQHPAVADVAVVGVPDARWGENVCAVVVPAGPLDPADLRAFARERLAGFKVPRHVVERESLPVNPSGKVVKADLRAWLAATPNLLGHRA